MKLSFSKIDKYERCPRAYKYHYVDGLREAPGVPLRFGSAMHSVLEALVKEQLATSTDFLTEKRAVELLQKAWAAEKLTGVDTYQDALSIIKAFVEEHNQAIDRDVLAVEKAFSIDVEGHEVVGFIDRLDRIDEAAVEVVDYKTNRNIFTREELDSSLQLNIYALAVLDHLPGIERVKLTFQLLRHGIKMSVERTRKELEATRQYIAAMGAAIEADTTFEPTINTYCSYCDHRNLCEAYTAALIGDREFFYDDDNLEALAMAREETAAMAKIINDRKKELDTVLKMHLKHNDSLELAGKRYSMSKTSRVNYPVVPTLMILEEETGASAEELLALIASIDKKALDAWLKGIGQERSLKAKLEEVAQRSYFPRMITRKAAA